MIVKSKKTSCLIGEGPHLATLTAVVGKPNDLEPKKVILRFKVDDREGEEDAVKEVTKDVPVSFEERSPLRKDVETLRGSQLTAKEAAEGLDLQSLIKSRCQVVVTHKSGVGGKAIAAVTLIQPLPKPAPAPNAAKPVGQE